MQLLDQLIIYHRDKPRYIQAYYGDLSAIQPEESVDLLVISAGRRSLKPSPGSVIGALHQRGLSVQELFDDRVLDLRESASCWFSNEISDPGLYGFRRLMCFSGNLGEPPQQVGDIFRGLWLFIGEDSQINSIAMPILATGYLGYSILQILHPLLIAAFKWLKLGLPIERIKIVAYSKEQVNDLKIIFDMFKQLRQPNLPVQPDYHYDYDAFFSYSHKDAEDVRKFKDRLLTYNKSIRVFHDEVNLDIGCAWQESLYQAIFSSRLVVPFYSPTYLTSPVCLEEFNLARTHHHLCSGTVLFPICLYNTPLPASMNIVQFFDCREADSLKLNQAAEKLSIRISILNNS